MRVLLALFSSSLASFLLLESEAFSLIPRTQVVSSIKKFEVTPNKVNSFDLPLKGLLPLFASNAANDVENNDKVVSSLPGWDPTNWTAPRFWNSLPFRSVALLSIIALTFKKGGINLSSSFASSIHLFSFASWFGTMFYTTFIFGITAFKNLPRRQFGKLQSKLFPKYFNLSAFAILLQILTLGEIPALAATKAYQALGVSFATTLLNLLVLEPESTKIMFDRYEMEDAPGGKESTEYKKLQAEFGKFHGISSLTNLVALCGAVVHGIYLSSLLV